MHPEHQGRGIGTGMLDVGIAKFVKATGGSNYAFVTNTAKNARSMTTTAVVSWP